MLLWAVVHGCGIALKQLGRWHHAIELKGLGLQLARVPACSGARLPR